MKRVLEFAFSRTAATRGSIAGLLLFLSVYLVPARAQDSSLSALAQSSQTRLVHTFVDAGTAYAVTGTENQPARTALRDGVLAAFGVNRGTFAFTTNEPGLCLLDLPTDAER